MEGLRWIRFLYAYPSEISPRLMDAVNSSEKICKYMDVPCSMSAHRTEIDEAGRQPGRSLRQMIKRIGRHPGITLRTTMVLGYPGETGSFLELKRILPGHGDSTAWGSSHTRMKKRRPGHCSQNIRRTAEGRRRSLMEQQPLIAIEKPEP